MGSENVKKHLVAALFATTVMIFPIGWYSALVLLFSATTRYAWIHNATNSFAGKEDDIVLILRAPFKLTLIFLLIATWVLIAKSGIALPKTSIGKTQLMFYGIAVSVHSFAYFAVCAGHIALLSQSMHVSNSQTIGWSRVTTGVGFWVLDWLIAFWYLCLIGWRIWSRDGRGQSGSHEQK